MQHFLAERCAQRFLYTYMGNGASAALLCDSFPSYPKVLHPLPKTPFPNPFPISCCIPYRLLNAAQPSLCPCNAGSARSASANGFCSAAWEWVRCSSHFCGWAQTGRIAWREKIFFSRPRAVYHGFCGGFFVLFCDSFFSFCVITATFCFRKYSFLCFRNCGLCSKIWPIAFLRAPFSLPFFFPSFQPFSFTLSAVTWEGRGGEGLWRRSQNNTLQHLISS